MHNRSLNQVVRLTAHIPAEFSLPARPELPFGDLKFLSNAGAVTQQWMLSNKASSHCTLGFWLHLDIWSSTLYLDPA